MVPGSIPCGKLVFSLLLCGGLRPFSFHLFLFQLIQKKYGNRNLVGAQPEKGTATVILEIDNCVTKKMIFRNDTSSLDILEPCTEFDHALKTEHKLQLYL